jgi:predicted metal-dependent hydrolase
MAVIWPPDYSIKRHPRARHVKLKASAQHGLEIVVPVRFNQKQIPDILEKNKAWIERRLEEIQQRAHLKMIETLPNVIELRAINEKWKVEYIKSDNKILHLMARPSKELVLLGDIDDKERCKKLITNWVKVQAEIHLSLLLEKLSRDTRLSFGKVCIRDQRSRWGSCSADKSINLNYKLLFLPPELTTHIIIHELCHTIHLNHSPKFWRLVESFDPEYKQHNTAIKNADAWVPPWC